MPDKPLTVITYAASASLAAIALVYFFSPNHLIDGSSSSASTRKKGVVGLSNPANDCFINSVLQSLAGLGDLRIYLIRELHRRALDGPEVYAVVPDTDMHGKPTNKRKLLSLQSGEVTKGLKDIIDGLNERPIYKKTISAAHFIGVLEHAFGTRISKAQQDAQELLQIVAERLSEEYHAGREARKRAREDQSISQLNGTLTAAGLGLALGDSQATESPPRIGAVRSATEDLEGENGKPTEEEEVGFPLEGRTESVIECQHCHFIPKSKPVSFVMLTLTVPQKSFTTLNECFDLHFKTEYIDDYKCDKCRLEHALSVFSKDLSRAATEAQKAVIQNRIDNVKRAIEDDPEQPPEDVELPDTKHAPARRIARHVRITDFPKVLVIHLQRSIYDPHSSSTKNAAKVSFPERLPIGGLLNRRNYKLLGLVTHKGTHNSGHYESFRRQHVYEPFSTPHLGGSSGPYSVVPSPNPSAIPSPLMTPRTSIQPEGVDGDPRSDSVPVDLLSPSTVSSSPTVSSAALSSPSPSTRPSSGSASGSLAPKRDSTAPSRLSQDQSITQDQSAEPSSEAPPQKLEPSPSQAAKLGRSKSLTDKVKARRKKTVDDRWWRISDDKIKECKTGDLLGMQREVYMLFYEIERE
ncbi:hypothetical protein MMC30_007457 [Trapelia coarctata]|nr:hypothetical protein [Trapelia coarctata]